MSEPETDAELVAVQDKSGERWCGALTEASTGSLGVSVDGSPVVVSLRDVVAVGPRRQLLGRDQIDRNDRCDRKRDGRLTAAYGPRRASR